MITISPSRDENTHTTIQTVLAQINVGQLEFVVTQANSTPNGIAIFCAIPLDVHMTREGILEVVPLEESEE